MSSEPTGPSVLGLVIPVFNEGSLFVENFREIRRCLGAVSRHRFRILIVDDGSTDDTLLHVRSVVSDDPDVSLLCLTRNFGKEAAIQAGLEHLGDDVAAAIVMDSDLQHPPALIPAMVKLWEGGIDIVEAQKISRAHDSAWSALLAGLFYRTFHAMTGMDIHNQSDFKLLDRRVLSFYRDLHEHNRFFRGIIHWSGFSIARLTFEVPQRSAGNSRWSRFKLWRYSIDAMTSFSSIPLHFITILGVLTFLVSIVFSAKALYDKFTGVALGGFTTVIVLQLFIGSILMISLGLIGIYLARIHDEVKRRPGYLIDWRKSLGPRDSHASLSAVDGMRSVRSAWKDEASEQPKRQDGHQDNLKQERDEIVPVQKEAEQADGIG